MIRRIVVHAGRDQGFDARLNAAIALATAFDARLVCTQITPFDAFIMGDPFGGVYALPAVAERIGEEEAEQRRQASIRLNEAKVSWDWSHFDGHPAHVLLQQSRLADLLIVSLAAPGDANGRLSIAADVLIHSRAPVLALPPEGASFESAGSAVIAWDGSAESAHALRLSVPMLRQASAVRLLTILNDRVEHSADDAVAYLRDHGVETETHERLADGLAVADALMAGATELGASYLVAGAYGHSRLREAVLGGTTRGLLSRSRIPLLLAH